jgi:hypothetical protein
VLFRQVFFPVPPQEPSADTAGMLVVVLVLLLVLEEDEDNDEGELPQVPNAA